jgi:3-oxoadipate enol-lactonase
MIVIAQTAALGRWEEFALHVRAALRLGDLDTDDLKEILLQTAVYCGVPTANHAFKEARAIVARAPRGQGPGQENEVTPIDLDAFDSGGGGEAVVLAHAIGCDARMWQGLVPVLRDRFRVLAFDARGHGGESRDAAPLHARRPRRRFRARARQARHRARALGRASPWAG